MRRRLWVHGALSKGNLLDVMTRDLLTISTHITSLYEDGIEIWDNHYSVFKHVRLDNRGGNKMDIEKFEFLPEIAKLGHVALVSADLEKSLWFFEEVVGLEKTLRLMVCITYVHGGTSSTIPY